MRILIPAAVAAITLALVPSAFGHAHVTPPVTTEDSNLYALAVPTEKEDLDTTGVELTVPDGFAVDAFMPAAGWSRVTQSVGSGEDAVVRSVRWTGGSVPHGEAAVFQFLARADSAKTYSFIVKQTYSDGSVVNWSGDENSDEPAPVVQVKSSLGGGGGTTLGAVALVVAAVALLLGIGGLAIRGGRRLA
jgi:uncharacterized protein YcnI